MADDTLAVVADIATDPVFAERLRAAAAKESAPGDPAEWVHVNRYALGAAPGWGAAVDFWRLSTGQVDGWQEDQSVITDGMILAQVQTMLAPPAPPPEAPS